MPFDAEIFSFFHNFAGRFVFLDGLAVFFAKFAPFFLILIFLFLIFGEKNRHLRIYFFAVAALSVILARGIFAEAIGFFYERPRPFEVLNFQPLISETGGAFPSGHAAFLFALAFSVFCFNKQWGYWFLSLSALNGLARIYAGVHWFGDILGGIFVGLLACFIVVKFLLNRSEKWDLEAKPEK